MTLDEQITKIEDDLTHFVETDQWLAAAQANQKRIDLIQLKEYICYVSVELREDDDNTP